MKRYILYIFSLLGTALLGVQCTEIFESEAAPAPTGTVEVSLTATRSATKTSLTETAAGLDAVWETGDTMYVVAPSGGSLGFLTAIESGVTAEFTGTISAWSGTQNLQFYYLGKGETITDGATSFNYDVSTQSGTLAYLATKQLMHGSKTSVPAGTTNFGSIVLTNLNSVGKFNLAANLDESATLTCGLAYSTASLDLATGVLTPSVGTINLGTNIPNASAYYMVLIPGTSHMQFSDGTTTLDMYRSIEADRFYCADGAGTAIVVLNMQIPGALSGGFSVGPSWKVQFSSGNLYFDGSSWNFEANQYDYRHHSNATNDAAVIGGVSTTTPSGTVGSLYWSATPSVAYSGGAWSDPSATFGDVFFTNWNPSSPNPDFTVNGVAGVWRTLDGGPDGSEWYYLINNRPNADSKVGYATVAGVQGLIILPDSFTDPGTNGGSGAFVPKATGWSASTVNYSSNVYTSGGNWEAMEAAGAVFLPSTGRRQGSIVDYVGANGGYWASNYSSSNYSYVFRFGYDVVDNYDISRMYAVSVRLVKNYVEVLPHYIVNGEDFGEGIKVGATIWAPVNCGYDPTNYPYGLLYQWGRVYGQGYEAGTLTPETLTMTEGQHAGNAAKFGMYNNTTFNWFSGSVDNTLWADSNKGLYDPCPAGWRVPTSLEILALIGSHTTGALQDGTGPHSGMKGYYFDGSTAAEPNSGVFLPASGYRSNTDGSTNNRTSRGYYWSSTPNTGNTNCANELYFYNNSISSSYGIRSFGFSVRCVKSADNRGSSAQEFNNVNW